MEFRGWRGEGVCAFGEEFRGAWGRGVICVCGVLEEVNRVQQPDYLMHEAVPQSFCAGPKSLVPST